MNCTLTVSEFRGAGTFCTSFHLLSLGQWKSRMKKREEISLQEKCESCEYGKPKTHFYAVLRKWECRPERNCRQGSMSPVTSTTMNLHHIRPFVTRNNSVKWSTARHLIGVAKLPQRSSAFIGCASKNVSPSNWQLWRIVPSTAPLRPCTVVFHPFCRHDIQTTAAVFYVTLSGSSARSYCLSIYSRQAGVSGFWCHRLERPASPHCISAVTRSLQTTTRDLSVFPFLPRYRHMTHVLLLPFITTVFVVLATINII